VRLLAALATACALVAGGRAWADADTATVVELGLELDGNVRRIETTDFQEPETAPMLRMAGRFDAGGQGMGGAFSVSANAHLRSSLSSEVTSEDYSQLSLDAQWTRPVRAGQVRLGPRLSYRDAFALSPDADDRTFRSVSADMIVVLYGERARVTVSAGPRYFDYKPDDVNATWKGGGAAARGDFPLWRGGEDDEDSLELSVVATLEQRAYDATAFTNVCAGDMAVDYRCFLPTARQRGDRLHRASASVAYTGAVAASAEAQLTVLDSNSYGRSWTGGRLRGAVTFELGKSYVTGIATLQIESYADRLLVARDPDVAVFDVLEDDNRSSAELRIGRPLTPHLVLEGRLAGWRDFSDELKYERVLGALGIVWTP
jgi:hypothetical protein